MKSKISLFLALVMLLAILSVPVSAATPGSSVTVSVASFKVTLNGQVYDSTYSEYPLLVYKDITYIPMTYYDSRWLGLAANWTAETGLEVSSDGTASAVYRPITRTTKNASSYTAAVPTFSITVNGTKIDTASETYPLLVFRDITYFPLTWRFCVTEFGWTYNWDAANGLVIDSASASAVPSGAYNWYLQDGILYRSNGSGSSESMYDASSRYAPQIVYYSDVADPTVPYLQFSSSDSPTMATMYRIALTDNGLGEPETRTNWDAPWN